MLRRRRRAATTLLALGATLTALALVSTPTGAGATPAPNTTERVSVSFTGGDTTGWSQRPEISADGNVVLFDSNAPELGSGQFGSFYLRNLATGVTTMFPIATTTITRPQLTGDGGKVVFDSTRNDLVPGDTNGKRDVFMYDVAAGTTSRVSLDSNGAQYPAGDSQVAGVSDDGRYVAFVTSTVQTANCQNNRVSVRDLVTAKTKIVQRCVITAALSGDGSALAVTSDATPSGCSSMLNHIEVSTLVSTTIGCGRETSLSGNGDVVAYKGFVPNGGGYTGYRAFDVASGSNEQIDVADDGTPGNGSPALADSGPVVSGNGRLVVFATQANNLVPGDGSTVDVFIRDLAAGTTRMVSVATDGTPGSHESLSPVISADGTVVAFHSRAIDLVDAPADANTFPDVFVRKLGPSVSTCGGATPTVTGTPGNDVLTGTPGNDVIDGLGGDDTIRGLGGNDVICGGAGSDTASFAGSAALVDADLALGTATGQGSDTLIGIENLEGSAYSDKLKGDAGANRFTGLGGADAISGFGGADRMDGGAANDKLYGHAGTDTLIGGLGNDLLSGGLDVDSLDGGDGTDTCGGDATDTPVTGCEG